MKQKNTDIKSIQDDFDDDLNIEFDEPLSYERFHRLLEHAKQISNQEKSDEHEDRYSYTWNIKVFVRNKL